MNPSTFQPNYSGKPHSQTEAVEAFQGLKLNRKWLLFSGQKVELQGGKKRPKKETRHYEGGTTEVISQNETTYLGRLLHFVRNNEGILRYAEAWL